jgi:hypothetical protein
MKAWKSRLQQHFMSRPYTMIPAGPSCLNIFTRAVGLKFVKSVQQSMNITTLEGLLVPRKQNCNTPFSGPNAKLHLQTCQNLQPYSLKTNFVAVEVPFQEIMPCTSFRTFAIIETQWRDSCRTWGLIGTHRNEYEILYSIMCHVLEIIIWMDIPLSIVWWFNDTRPDDQARGLE